MTVNQLEIEQASLQLYVKEAVRLTTDLKSNLTTTAIVKYRPSEDLRIYWDKER